MKRPISKIKMLLIALMALSTPTVWGISAQKCLLAGGVVLASGACYGLKKAYDERKERAWRAADERANRARSQQYFPVLVSLCESFKMLEGWREFFSKIISAGGDLNRVCSAAHVASSETQKKLCHTVYLRRRTLKNEDFRIPKTSERLFFRALGFIKVWLIGHEETWKTFD
jgi:hypothetical protein